MKEIRTGNASVMRRRSRSPSSARRSTIFRSVVSKKKIAIRCAPSPDVEPAPKHVRVVLEMGELAR